MLTSQYRFESVTASERAETFYKVSSKKYRVTCNVNEIGCLLGIKSRPSAISK